MTVKESKIFRQASFVLGATEGRHFPNSNLPEVAFVGRSNVGKSSLINSITNNGKLARVSKSPGCTRQINFFDLGSTLMLVDLPGYGYAKASKAEIKKWTNCMIKYLSERKQLRKIFLLIDSRVGIKMSDIEMIELIEMFATTCQVVLTKFDKIAMSEGEKTVKDIEEFLQKYAICVPKVIISSSRESNVLEVRHSMLSIL